MSLINSADSVPAVVVEALTEQIRSEIGSSLRGAEGMVGKVFIETLKLPYDHSLEIRAKLELRHKADTLALARRVDDSLAKMGKVPKERLIADTMGRMGNEMARSCVKWLEDRLPSSALRTDGQFDYGGPPYIRTVDPEIVEAILFEASPHPMRKADGIEDWDFDPTMPIHETTPSFHNNPAMDEEEERQRIAQERLKARRLEEAKKEALIDDFYAGIEEQSLCL